MKTAQPSSNQRVAHGIVFTVIMACTFSVPGLRRWPWIWLAPFIAYFVLVACVRPLRHSLNWLRFGDLSVRSVVATIVIIALTILSLLFFQKIVQPDVHHFRAAFPFERLGGVVVAGVIFTVANATSEEFVFRGILFDALQSQWGTRITLIVTALLFGLGHLRGYPSGLVGACLASVFGFAAGVLRSLTGGLALPIVAHLAADATIYGILVSSGAI